MSPTALIIDDNALNNDVLVTLLNKEGIRAFAIESPRYLDETLHQIEAVDVVFLDLEFPKHDGFVLLHELKAEPRLQGVPIVAYSVHTSEIDQARKAGFHSFLGKPVDGRRFPDLLTKILNHIPVWEI